MIKNLMLKLSAPLRWMIRHELWAFQQKMYLNISAMRQHKALVETADYVDTHMPHLDSFGSAFDLLTAALTHVKDRNGLFLEFGVFSGQTINHVAARIDGQIYGFDSFEGLPERWRDGLGPGYFKVAELPAVRKNVVLIKGWFDKTLPVFLKDHSQRVAFLHVDCDLYSSTKTIFDLLGSQIQDGTVIVFDEYFNYAGWREGEYKAFQEFLKTSGLTYEYLGYNRYQEQVAVKIKSKTGA
jgi:hypothetical protein